MKKALMTAVAMTLGVASAASSSSTNLNFRTTVVPGCAVAMNSSYTNTVVPTYNGTMANPQSATIATANPIMRCQTGTGVSIRSSARIDAAASNDSDGFAAGMIDSAPSSNVTLTGRLSLRLQANNIPANNVNDDNKTLDGDYSIVFTKQNIAGGNGDTYSLSASFEPDQGWFEAMVGDYVGTVNVTIEY